MADLKDKKVAYCVELTRQAEIALATLRNLSEMTASYSSNGFAPNGANPITDGDLNGSTVQHLTPAIIQGVIGAFNDMTALAQGQYSNLRKAVTKPLGNAAAIGPR